MVYLILFCLCVLSGVNSGLSFAQAMAGAGLALIFVLIIEQIIKAVI